MPKKTYAFREFSSDATLGEAREWLREEFEQGATCPCCQQGVKLRKQGITAEMAYGLIILNQVTARSGEEWFHMPTVLAEFKAGKTNMFGLLSHWGLVDRMPGEREDGSVRTGWYRITEKGKQFAEGRVTVNKYVYTYNSQLLRRKNPDLTQIDIKSALKERFNYDELMGNVPDGSYGQTGI